MYSDPLDGVEDGPPPRTADVTIGGKAGRIRLWRTSRGNVPFRIGLHVPLIIPTSLGALRLTISGQVPTEQAAARVETMLKTIRFQPLG